MTQSRHNEKPHPWVSIWTHPRDTMRSILQTDPRSVIIWLALISGIISALVMLGNLWMKYPYRENIRYSWVIASFIVAGALLGLFHLYFLGWLYRVVGNWLGGKGTFVEVKASVGWANYPFILSGIVGILAFFLVRYPVGYFILYALNIIISIWAVIIALNLLAEAHRFSVWRAIGTFIISMLLIVAVVMLILLIIPVFPVYRGTTV